MVKKEAGKQYHEQGPWPSTCAESKKQFNVSPNKNKFHCFSKQKNVSTFLLTMMSEARLLCLSARDGKITSQSIQSIIFESVSRLPSMTELAYF